MSLPLTIAQAADELRAKKYSAVELTKLFLLRIKHTEPHIHALLTVTEDEALKQAALADARLAKGDASQLLGIPVIYKDNFLTKGVRTTAGSNILDNYIAQYDADVVNRMKQAGAVMLGKANLDAFAHGSSTENSDFGPSRNPWNTELVPGGSSGGSAAALAARQCLVATGSDTGGSIRQPASFTNTVGLKPTYGRVSRRGVIAMGSSFDSIGHFTRTVEDSAAVLQITAGASEGDATTALTDVPQYTAELDQSIVGMKLGIPKEFMVDNLDPQIANLVEAAIKVYESLGATIMPVSLPHSSYSLAAYYILVPSELSSNLSRFDGIRFGHAAAGATTLLQRYEQSRSEGFGAEAKRRIMLGTYALSSGYYDAYYRKAQQVRQLVKQDFDTVFAEVDALLAPVSPILPFKIGEKAEDPLAMYLSDILTVPVNLAGVPSLALPCGFVDNLPVGMQLIGPDLSESRLFALGHQYQQATDWHSRLAMEEV